MGLFSKKTDPEKLTSKGISCYNAKKYAEAFAFIEEAAALGFPEAQSNLAILYKRGHGTQQDLSKAAYWYEQAALQGHRDAQYALAELYSEGQGVERDLAKAAHWYEQAAAQGHIDAQVDMGMLYYNGKGWERDIQKAMQWFEKAAEQGHAGAMNNLGYIYRNSDDAPRDLVKAAQWYEKAAEKGHITAQNNLAYMYQVGEGVEQHLKMAKYWYEKAAVKGGSASQYNLGKIYENGLGVGIDYKMAESWYEKAAEQGDEQAKEALENVREIIREQAEAEAVFDEGDEHYSDDELDEAAECFAKAARMGFAEAYYRLAEMYLNGDGVENDEAKAIELYEQASLKGYSKASLFLALWYLYRTSAEPDKEKADDWARKALREGEEDAKEVLDALHNPMLVSEDLIIKGMEYHENGSFSSAVACFEKAVSLGNNEAAYFLGVLYHEGKGVKQDYVRAFEMTEKAALCGNGDAMCFLSMLCAGGMGVEPDLGKAELWAKKAVEQGAEGAEELLDDIMQDKTEAESEEGRLFEKGLAHARNEEYEEALKCYMNSALKGYGNAQIALGMMYRDGDGVKADVKEAVRWFTLAAEGGIDIAQHDLAMIYADEECAVNDAALAAYWFEKAALQNDADSQIGLALMYAMGDGIGMDSKKAEKYAKMTLENGHEQAAKLLEAIEGLKGFQEDQFEYIGPFMLHTEELINIGVDCFTRGEHQKAGEYFERAALRDPGIDTKRLAMSLGDIKKHIKAAEKLGVKGARDLLKKL